MSTLWELQEAINQGAWVTRKKRLPSLIEFYMNIFLHGWKYIKELFTDPDIVECISSANTACYEQRKGEEHPTFLGYHMLYYYYRGGIPEPSLFRDFSELVRHVGATGWRVMKPRKLPKEHQDDPEFSRRYENWIRAYVQQET